jgi:chromosome segregation ATPase
MADANREMDTLYGSGRIAKMGQVNKLLDNEVKLLEAKAEEAERYLDADTEAMKNAFSAAGVTLTTNADGTINTDNIEATFDALDAEYNDLVDDYNEAAEAAWADGVISATEQAALDAIKETMDAKAEVIDEAKAAYDQYNDTLNEIETTQDDIADKQNEMKANNY